MVAKVAIENHGDGDLLVYVTNPKSARYFGFPQVIEVRPLPKGQMMIAEVHEFQTIRLMESKEDGSQKRVD